MSGAPRTVAATAAISPPPSPMSLSSSSSSLSLSLSSLKEDTKEQQQAQSSKTKKSSKKKSKSNHNSHKSLSASSSKSLSFSNSASSLTSTSSSKATKKSSKSSSKKKSRSASTTSKSSTSSSKKHQNSLSSLSPPPLATKSRSNSTTAKKSVRFSKSRKVKVYPKVLPQHVEHVWYQPDDYGSMSRDCQHTLLVLEKRKSLAGTDYCWRGLENWPSEQFQARQRKLFHAVQAVLRVQYSHWNNTPLPNPEETIAHVYQEITQHDIFEAHCLGLADEEDVMGARQKQQGEDELEESSSSLFSRKKKEKKYKPQRSISGNDRSRKITKTTDSQRRSSKQQTEQRQQATTKRRNLIAQKLQDSITSLSLSGFSTRSSSVSNNSSSSSVGEQQQAQPKTNKRTIQKTSLTPRVPDPRRRSSTTASLMLSTGVARRRPTPSLSSLLEDALPTRAEQEQQKGEAHPLKSRKNRLGSHIEDTNSKMKNRAGQTRLSSNGSVVSLQTI